MTELEILSILPRLRGLSKAAVFNGCSREDLVQEAVLHLLSSPGKYKNPFVFAYSRMRDYCRANGLERYNGRGNRVLVKMELVDLIGDLGVHENIDWKGFNLTHLEEEVVKRICEEDYTQAELAKILKISPSLVSITWLSALRKIRIKWNISSCI
jgi:DNA-binding CsgD family transcriptional regulator